MKFGNLYTRLEFKKMHVTKTLISHLSLASLNLCFHELFSAKTETA